MSVIVLVYLLMSSTCAGAKSDGSSVPAYIVWILVACVGGIVLVAAIVLIVVVCVRRRRPNKRATDSDPPNDESVLYTCVSRVESVNQSINQSRNF